MPGVLGHVELQRLVLHVRALRYVPAAAPLLAVWFASLRKAHSDWLEHGEEARLTRHDVLRAASGDEELALQASSVLLKERWGLGGGHGLPEDRDWWAEIISEIRLVRDADSAGELLDVRDQREYPSSETGGAEVDQQVEQAPSERILFWRRLWNWAVEHYIGAVLAGLTVLLIVALIGLLVSSLSGDDDTTREPSTVESPESTNSDHTAPPPGPGILEEAGEAGARTYRDPFDLSQTGRSVSPFQQVRVECRLHAPTLSSVTPDGYWYLLLSPPWNGNYYAPANSFWNGDIPGQMPYTHNTDFDVPKCSQASGQQAERR